MNPATTWDALTTELYRTPGEFGHATSRLYSGMRLTDLYCKNHVPMEYIEMIELTRGYKKLSGYSSRLVYGR